MTDPKTAKAVEVVKPAENQPAELLISQAIDKGVDIETMERLMTIRREMRAEAIKAAFDNAMSNFQASCPTITKTKKVMNKDGMSVRYLFAPIDKIIEQVKEHLKENGLSYTIKVNVADGWVESICTVNHSMGHSETSSFKVPIDPKAFMNEAQKFASAQTFTKRYAFCNAFGIMTGDEDDDSSVAGGESSAGVPDYQNRSANNPPPILKPDFIKVLICQRCKQKFNKNIRVSTEQAAISQKEFKLDLCVDCVKAGQSSNKTEPQSEVPKSVLDQWRDLVAACTTPLACEKLRDQMSVDPGIGPVLTKPIDMMIDQQIEKISRPKSA